ncbi:MAG: polyprenyl synthetase family protein [Myxococcota bacterium]
MPTLLTLPASAPIKGCWNDDDMDQVERAMTELATGDRFERLGVLAREHLATGGKRLRARLALATLQALGGDRARGVAWAAATELLHNATLVHDDIQDGDPMRRGRPAIWSRHGVNQAINVGDLMLMLPYRAVAKVQASDAIRWALADALSRYAEEVVRGQAAELDLLSRGRFEWEAYQEAVEGKTAALFALPVYGAARLAGLSQDDADALASEMRPIGLLFQVADDVLDLYGDKGREAPGSDLREGKVSALVVEHLALHPEDRTWLHGLLATDRDLTPPEDVTRAIRAFRERGALHRVWDRLGAIEERVHDSAILARAPKLHAAAFDLVARALLPILHTDGAHR